ncbi:hypothetical protein MNEG_15002 [Monoraphidium neglectum]|uniref:Uncharacterized protein n=1 Tax=Monoraphidium neglectum TaxID=145388 RepID=A0A0D2LTB1_9CHLO|nr:hypothetical protein MNEG_15002 [Monoraphidium neglectum]KIY92961.1 hypothetical protein MNEG_15002 [Monoraphidium neglectum]|eukprot:XP_013891981.1 hypothetical protein MNEG_15002 [Monoraphidium neglectum]
MADPRDNAPIKLCDWGFASFIKPGQKLKGLAGTCYYVAPEVIMGTYDERADVWSCGVLLYVLLSGRPPFCAHKDEDVFRMVVEDGVPNMREQPWPSISAAAKDAVRQMMTWRAELRPSAKEMLQHEWIREGGVAGDNVIQQEVLHRMKSFAGMNKFKKHAAMVIASHLPSDQIRGLNELFDSMDTDGSGTITLDELRRACS